MGDHTGGQVEQLYGSLPVGARVAVEASGNTLWFERLLRRCGHELWMGDATEIRKHDARKQKHDRRDARLIVKLLGNGALVKKVVLFESFMRQSRNGIETGH